jgi:hypothetical protein
LGSIAVNRANDTASLAEEPVLFKRHMRRPGILTARIALSGHALGRNALWRLCSWHEYIGRLDPLVGLLGKYTSETS